MTETITQYFARMAAKDIEKHGMKGREAGIRSTTEVAQYFGWSSAVTRRKLRAEPNIVEYDFDGRGAQEGMAGILWGPA